MGSTVVLQSILSLGILQNQNGPKIEAFAPYIHLDPSPTIKIFIKTKKSLIFWNGTKKICIVDFQQNEKMWAGLKSFSIRLQRKFIVVTDVLRHKNAISRENFKVSDI